MQFRLKLHLHAGHQDSDKSGDDVSYPSRLQQVAPYDIPQGRSLARVHAIADAEVSANLVSTRRCSVLRKLFCLVLNIGNILSIIDPDCTSISVAGLIYRKQWVWPMPALAQPYKALVS